MRITPQTHQLLNFIGHDFVINPDKKLTWQQSLYARLIKEPVRLALAEQDFQAFTGLAQASKIAAYVDNWKDDQKDDLKLTEILADFGAFTVQLPNAVKERLQSKTLEKHASVAYQRLVMIEVVKRVADLAASPVTAAADIAERDRLLKWAKAKEETLAKIEFKQIETLKRIAVEIKQALIADFPAQIYQFFRKTLPRYVVQQFNLWLQIVRSYPLDRSFIKGLGTFLESYSMFLLIPFLALGSVVTLISKMLLHAPIQFFKYAVDQISEKRGSNRQALFLYASIGAISFAALAVLYVVYVAMTYIPSILFYSSLVYAGAVLGSPIVAGVSWLFNRFGYKNEWRSTDTVYIAHFVVALLPEKIFNRIVDSIVRILEILKTNEDFIMKTLEKPLVPVSELPPAAERLHVLKQLKAEMLNMHNSVDEWVDTQRGYTFGGVVASILDESIGKSRKEFLVKEENYVRGKFQLPLLDMPWSKDELNFDFMEKFEDLQNALNREEPDVQPKNDPLYVNGLKKAQANGGGAPAAAAAESVDPAGAKKSNRNA